jgi:hypothetical protein
VDRRWSSWSRRKPRQIISEIAELYTAAPADIAVPSILIKIERQWRPSSTAAQLYERTRRYWKCNPERRAVPPRYALARQHQHLDEAVVRGAALDLLRGELGILCRDHDRGAESRLAVEPFLGQPVIDGATERSAHVLAVEDLAGVETVEDRDPRTESIERLPTRLLEIAARRSFRWPPIGPRR